jgi:flagella basal body P-ring formation protein FlgA
MRLRLLAVMALVMTPAPALPGAISGADAVALVHDAMRSAGANIVPMAVPLRALPACDHTPVVAPVGGSWARVELRCDTPAPWRRILRTDSPVAAVAARDPSQPVTTQPLALVATRPLVRGQRLVASDLQLRPAPARLGALTNPDLATGRRLRAAVADGQPILERHLDPAHDMLAGDQIALLLSRNGIDISLGAIALDNGWIGDRVRVQPANSTRVVQAVVIGRGQAQINPNIAP